MTAYIVDFPSAYIPSLEGLYRVKPEDFRVDELLDIPLSGRGEHLWLKVRKTNSNTDWVAGQLARVAGLSPAEVGYAGLKDRYAVTTQWFSLQLAGKTDPSFQALPPEIEVLEAQRHDKKLRRGALLGNYFELTLRECSGDWSAAQQLCQEITQQGVPNYFGAQRFGNELGNLHKAEAWFSGAFKPKQRQQISLYLSAARSWIFNHILAERVRSRTWHQRMAGDIFQFEGGSAWFADDASPDLSERLKRLEIHPTGALWGRGALLTQTEMLHLEMEQAARFGLFCQGLEQQGLKQERRALRVKVENLQLRSLDEPKTTLGLSFSLAAGAYATVVLAQLGRFSAQVEPMH